MPSEPLPSLQPPTRTPNLAPEFIRDCEAKLGLRFVPEATAGPGEGADIFSPEDVFHYIYAIFHSPKYRERYAEFLRIDFPRVPLTTSVPLFRCPDSTHSPTTKVRKALEARVDKCQLTLYTMGCDS